mmetsp:Transcript_34470/g.55305  ORF Transcript_34470/g.55305 Transcript_34470/m.55305 type:complete len:515 (-) Transcript_34470:168-1712(-)
MQAPEDDSSAESDDDVVLDQSLAANSAANPDEMIAPPKPIMLQQAQSQPAIASPSQPMHGDTDTMMMSESLNDAVSAAVVDKAVITPTIITIAPPTLKSNKSSALSHSHEYEQKPVLAPSATATASSSATVAATTTTTTTTSTSTATVSGPAAPPIPFDAQAMNERKQKEKEKDEVIRPRIDPKLLKLMMKEQSVAVHAHDNNLMDLDLDCFTQKPWTAPNADITDWFNYGFNEETWRQYCYTQMKMRHILKRNQFASTSASIPSSSYPTMSHGHAHSHSHDVAPIMANPHPHPHAHPHPHPHPHVHVHAHPTPTLNTNTNANANVNVTSNAHSNTHSNVGNGICFDFQNKGHCLRGASCRWSHHLPAPSVWQHSHVNPPKPETATHTLRTLQTLHAVQPVIQAHTEKAEESGEAEAETETERERERENEAKSTDQLQARLQVLLGEAPNIPSVVSSLLGANEEEKDSGNKKRKKRKKKKKERRSRSRSASRSESRSNSRSRSRSRRSETESKD